MKHDQQAAGRPPAAPPRVADRRRMAARSRSAGAAEARISVFSYVRSARPRHRATPKDALWSLVFANSGGSRKTVVFGPGPFRDRGTYSRCRALFIYPIAADPIVQEADRTFVYLPDDELVDDYRDFLARQTLPPRAIEFISL